MKINPYSTPQPATGNDENVELPTKPSLLRVLACGACLLVGAAAIFVGGLGFYFLSHDNLRRSTFQMSLIVVAQTMFFVFGFGAMGVGFGVLRRNARSWTIGWSTILIAGLLFFTCAAVAN